LKTQRPSFGFFRSITRDDYVKAIDDEDPNVFVVIHLYQSFITDCLRMNKCLTQLAQKYFHVKFLKLIASEASEKFEDVTLPTLLIYKGGELYTSIVRIQDFLRPTWDVDDVSALLSKKKVI